MKLASTIARYLLGLMFTIFGLNGFLQFIHQPPPANPTALQFLIAVSTSHFAAFFFLAQLIGGLLLLSATLYRSHSLSSQQRFTTSSRFT